MTTLPAGLQEIVDGHYYYTDKNWKFGLEDGVQRQFGIYIEIVNMDDATGEKEFKDYPFLVSMQIVPDKVHKSFKEKGSSPGSLCLLSDAVAYAGGVPVDHILTDDVNKGLSEIVPLFNVGEAMLKTSTQTFGTVAAQKGKGTTFQYLQFKTADIAMRYVQFILEHRVMALQMMIGFILDRPINMAGNTGWETMETLVNGSQWRKSK